MGETRPAVARNLAVLAVLVGLVYVGLQHADLLPSEGLWSWASRVVVATLAAGRVLFGSISTSWVRGLG